MLSRCSPPVRITRSGIGHAGGVERPGDRGLVDLVGGHAALDQAPEGVDDLGPAGVVEGDVQQEPFARLGRRQGIGDRAAGVRRELVEPSQEADADTLLRQLGRLALDRVLEQLEQAGHLVVRTRPVLAAEGVQREDRHTAPDDVAQQGPDGLHAGRVAFELGPVMAARPAAVAVHDDRDVVRQVLGRDVRHERRVRGGPERVGVDARRAFADDRRRVGRAGQGHAGH